MKPAFESIYKENHEKVYRLCLGYVHGDADMAKDLSQEVFIKIWNHLPNFRGASKLSTWIYRITVNTCLMELRKPKYVSMTATPDIQETHGTDDGIDHEKRYAKMFGCISKLKTDDRTLILLDLEGVPQKEIASVIGVSHDALRVRIHRIKKSLTKCVQDGKL